jgi:GNAT superfamily N-acetyltransferase
VAEPRLRFAAPVDDAALEDWRRIHNAIIPPHPLSLADVRERAGRNRLEVAYLGGVAVGNSTVRPPDDAGVATVIVRVLPPYRGLGIGDGLYARGLAAARDVGAAHIETVVLAANPSGLRFAKRHGFVETDRYTVDGAAYVTLRLR